MDGMVLSGDDEDQYAQRDDASDGVSRWLRRDHSQNVLEGSEGDETSSEDGKVVDSGEHHCEHKIPKANARSLRWLEFFDWSYRR